MDPKLTIRGCVIICSCKCGLFSHVVGEALQTLWTGAHFKSGGGKAKLPVIVSLLLAGKFVVFFWQLKAKLTLLSWLTDFNEGLWSTLTIFFIRSWEYFCSSWRSQHQCHVFNAGNKLFDLFWIKASAKCRNVHQMTAKKPTGILHRRTCAWATCEEFRHASHNTSPSVAVKPQWDTSLQII